MDCAYCISSELCYECADLDHAYNCMYSQEVKNCTDCFFCYNCVGCKNCFGCAGLRQKEYCVYNEYVGKEKFQEFIKNFSFKIPAQMDEATRKMRELDLKTPRKYMHEISTERCYGDYILNSKNCFSCFDTYDSEDCMYMIDCWHTKDSCDVIFSDGSELCYECFSFGLGTYNCNFSNYLRSCVNCEYSELLFNCKDCFGCVGLQGKQYYILNQPYTRDEYVKKVAEIKAQMRLDGTYGQHLPTTYRIEDTAAV